MNKTELKLTAEEWEIVQALRDPEKGPGMYEVMRNSIKNRAWCEEVPCPCHWPDCDTTQ